FGAVSSTHWIAAQCGISVLERGGNAFDAAVAAGFVLQVVEPHLNGLGGEVPIVLWDVTRKKVDVICGQGPAPTAAGIQRIRKMGLGEVPGTGLIAACVPGAFAAWLALLRDHGTWRLADVLEFAIGYAESGYPLLPRITDTLVMVEPLFREHWPSSAAVYLGGGVPRPGQRFHNRDLAATYRRLLRDTAPARGREEQIEAALRSFYSGFVAEAVDLHCRHELMDSSGVAHPGLLTAADLAAFQARREDPVTADFRGWTVAKCGPWSQGPVFLQQLQLLAPYDLASTGFLSADHIHLVTECAKLAFADRHGNLVACTPSGGWLQSSPVIPGLGFCLGTRAQMFNLDPQHPNHLEGGKRPRTTLSPSLALRDGEPCLAFGTPGGDQQDQWTLEFFLTHAVFGQDLQASIDAPMFHTTHFPSSFAPHDSHPGRLHSEPMEPGVLDELRRRGHDVFEADRSSLGRICAVGIDHAT